MNLKRELFKVEALLISMGIVYLAFGIFLNFKPQEVKQYSGLAMSVVILLFSLIVFILYVRKERVMASLSMGFTTGGLLLAGGILSLLKRSIVSEHFVLFVVCLLFFGTLIKLQKAIDLWRIECNWWVLILILSIASIAGCVMLMLNTAFVVEHQDLLVVIFMCIDGGASLITSLVFGLRMRKAIRVSSGFVMDTPAAMQVPWLHNGKVEAVPEEEAEAADAGPALGNEAPLGD